MTEKEATVWWCNFCDFKTTDPTAYLQHSCTEVLKQKGADTPHSSGGKAHCR